MIRYPLPIFPPSVGSLSSRRCPVSVDPDLSTPTATHPKRLGSSGGSASSVTKATRGGGGGAEESRGGVRGYNPMMGHAPTDPGMSSDGFSNRNSHPFTEDREVEQQMEGECKGQCAFGPYCEHEHCEWCRMVRYDTSLFARHLDRFRSTTVPSPLPLALNFSGAFM